MDALTRLRLLSAQTAFDLDGEAAPSSPADALTPKETEGMFIHSA